MGAPGLVWRRRIRDFDPTTIVSGHDPRRPGEATVLEQNADRQRPRGGRRDRRRDTPWRTAPSRSSGIERFGEAGSAIGGATVVGMLTGRSSSAVRPRGTGQHDQRDREPGVDPAELVGTDRGRPPARRARSDGRARTRTRRQTEINDQIGSFLTPALLALAGAAVLVGGVHHLQHLLDHRRPADARVRDAAGARRHPRPDRRESSGSRPWRSGSSPPPSASPPASPSRSS